VSEAHAVTIARAHVEAWSNHDYDEARKSLAADVKVTVTTTIEGARRRISQVSTTTCAA